MALSIIGSGFGRTGTFSLKAALEQLGFGPCHHMTEIFKNSEQVPLWRDALAGKAVDWEMVFTGYRSQLDWPGAHFWRELGAAFPEAKVVHSIRPPQSWWKSFSDTLGPSLSNYEAEEIRPGTRATLEVAAQVVNLDTDGDMTNREQALAAFQRRTEDVVAAIPAERLLVFDVAEGWEPLCRFLGAPVPDKPFPHHHKTAEFWEERERRRSAAASNHQS